MAREHLRLFVACGTGVPFRRLLHAVEPLASLPELELFVQRGPGADEFDGLPGAELISRDAFAERLRWAHVVACHGGAGTLFEAYRAGHVPLTMPRLGRYGEHVNDHQQELVAALDRRGLARWIRQGEPLNRYLEAYRPVPTAERADPVAQALSAAVSVALIDPARRRAAPMALVRLSAHVLTRIAGRWRSP